MNDTSDISGAEMILPNNSGDHVRGIKRAAPVTDEDLCNKAYVDSTAGAGHLKLHAITSTLDHTSTATAAQMLQADANGLPVDASNTDAEVAAAIIASHTAGTDPNDHVQGTDPNDHAESHNAASHSDITASGADLDDAVMKKHADTLDHTQGTDTGLDTGGANPSTAAEVASAVALVSLASAKIFVGSAGGVTTAVAVSGDVAITNAGVTTVSDLTISNEAEGDILYRGAAAWIRLAKGDNADVLTLAAGVPTWAAPAASGASIATGTYTGDGSTSLAITGIGFQPKFLIIWIRNQANNGNQFVYMTSDQETANLSCMFRTAGILTKDNRIISLDADGFTVDDNLQDAPPNKNSETYQYVAWG